MPDNPGEPAWLAAGRHHVWLPYTAMGRPPAALPVVATEGVRLHLADGRTLIDGMASWWTACHGYNHPHIAEAVARQLRVMPHVMFGGLGHEPAYRLATRLAGLLPGDLDHVFFTDSGSVAVEVALKMAVQFWLNQGVAGRHRFVAFRGGYHGDTLGAMSVCDPEEGMHQLFAGHVPQQLFAELPSDAGRVAALDRLLAGRAHEIAAVILEPLVQGAGGMRFHDAGTLAAVRAACDRHGCLLILDEIMTGFGRTGSLFACQAAGIVPDIICLSKALTGGTLALAATVATARVFAAFQDPDPARALMHGPTFMGNPLACAAANAALDLFETEPRLDQVGAIAGQLAAELAPCRGLAGVVDVRVMGAIGVVQLESGADARALRPKLVEAGVWVRPFGDIVYLMPAFTITPGELSVLTGAVCRVVRDWSAGRP